MKKMVDILLKLLFPPVFVVVILVVAAVVGLVYAFGTEDANIVLSCTAYFVSAYALTVVCARVPEMYKAINEIKENNKYIHSYVNDEFLRIRVSLYTSVVMNGLYTVFQLGLGIYHNSAWFGALALYYLCLFIIRIMLIKYIKKNTPGENYEEELRKLGFCGKTLFCMNVVLAIIVFFIMWQNKSFEHHYITVIAMAAFTFTTFTLAVINTVKYRKSNSPVLWAVKYVGLVSATVSILTLQTAMLSAFSENNDESFKQIMTAFTGAAVCVTVLALAVYMTRKSKYNKRRRNKYERE